MKKILLVTLIISYFSSALNAQSITIEPYLQDASPNSIYILWETDSDSESIVEWGLTNALGNTTMGTAYTSQGSAMVHEVHLENLEKFTKYFYRVKTNTAESDIFFFKTSPKASDNEAFRIVAMSDMQQDFFKPNKFEEIVEDGVLDYLDDEFGGELTDNVAMVLIPGDLVVNGNDYSSWKNTFFNPAENLLSHVPVYPVLGNHEVNSDYYFTYFKMPDNGTAGFEEHWWHKDYGNVRIIGMNSNPPFDNATQLLWLDNLLTQTCAEDSIDFVFAELHHPHKSELWTPGESDFTGEVIDRLEQFTTTCDKPSIHYFGHTHGYSRGQSRDHKHLWINVASAGGAIDNWGEFPNFDYDEFSVSQDEYGFVLIEVTDDPDPKVVVKRIGRGDQDVIIDNELRDSLVLRLNPTIVNIPIPIEPVDEVVTPECVILVGNAFSSPNPDAEHGQSHWQVTTLLDGFNNPVAESWKNFENWYDEIDTQNSDDLTDQSVSGLEEFTDYIWRVRYRDKELNWSEWTAPAEFTTGSSNALTNLILNPDAEDGVNNWTVAEGFFESLESGVCNGIAPYNGIKYFAVGGLCDDSEIGRAFQNIDVSAYSDSIDIGSYPVEFGGYFSNFAGDDLPEMKLIFLDDNLMEISQSSVLSTLNSSWTLLSSTENIPELTRSIQVELKGTRNAGTDNDSYLDDLFLTVGTSKICPNAPPISGLQAVNIQSLNIYPNPAQNSTTVIVPESLKGNYLVGLTEIQGRKIQAIYKESNNTLSFNLEHLTIGTYFIWLRGDNGQVYAGKLNKQ